MMKSTHDAPMTTVSLVSRQGKVKSVSFVDLPKVTTLDHVKRASELFDHKFEGAVVSNEKVTQTWLREGQDWSLEVHEQN